MKKQTSRQAFVGLGDKIYGPVPRFFTPAETASLMWFAWQSAIKWKNATKKVTAK